MFSMQSITHSLPLIIKYPPGSVGSSFIRIRVSREHPCVLHNILLTITGTRHNLKLLISSVLTFVVPFLKYAVAVIDALTRKLALYVLSSNKATLGYKISSLPE